ncbi:MAG: hypothetical protein IKB61_02650 [Elusimicrobiaceae bacterium]|nr:hypothetical protein [Elusimicrobiaceae bacterium]MBR4355108.1 hypothetical protein [Elusimicrobiaceae bacterium]
MSVLNNFMLVFETEGDKTTRQKIEQIDSAGKKLAKTNRETGDSAAVMGRKASTAAGQFRQMSRALAGAIAPAMALGAVLSQTLNFAMQGEQLLFMAKSANMAADEFQKLAIASQRFGGSREGAAGMMAGLASQIQALRLGQSAPLQDAAMFYGLNLQGKGGGLATGNELLRNIAATMERLDSAAQLDLGHRIGLDEATIRILQQGVAAFDEEMERAEKRSIFKPEDLKRAQEFQMATRDLQLSLQGLWAEIARWLLPAVQSLTEYATQAFDYLTEHSDAVKAALVGIAVVMGAIAVSSLAAFAPWIGMAAIIAGIGAAIALLYEDFMVFAEGGSSALGPLWQTLIDFGKWWQELPGWIKSAFDALLNFLNPLRAIKKAFEAFKGFKESLTGTDQLATADSNPLASIPGGAISNVYRWMSNNIKNSFMLTVNGVQDPVQGGADLLNQARGNDIANLTDGYEV